jgi:hypothetical protein
MESAVTVADQVEQVVRQRPGFTEREIAEELFSNPYQQRVNSVCRMLALQCRVRRSGAGGASDPYRYHPET